MFKFPDVKVTQDNTLTYKDLPGNQVFKFVSYGKGSFWSDIYRYKTLDGGYVNLQNEDKNTSAGKYHEPDVWRNGEHVVAYSLEVTTAEVTSGHRSVE